LDNVLEKNHPGPGSLPYLAQQSAKCYKIAMIVNNMKSNFTTCISSTFL
jgi:hypothetical protein